MTFELSRDCGAYGTQRRRRSAFTHTYRHYHYAQTQTLEKDVVLLRPADGIDCCHKRRV